MKLVLLAISIAFTLASSQTIFAGASYHSRFNVSEPSENKINIIEDKDDYLKFTVTENVSISGMDFSSNDIIRLYKGQIYSVALASETMIKGYLVAPDSKYTVIFYSETGDLSGITLAKTTNIEGINWPAGSRVTFLESSKCKISICIRSVVLGDTLTINDKIAVKGQSVNYSARKRSPRIIPQ